MSKRISCGSSDRQRSCLVLRMRKELLGIVTFGKQGQTAELSSFANEEGVAKNSNFG